MNVRSAVSKAALIHDVIVHHALDIAALTETWITSDAPSAVSLDVAPPGYRVIHAHRGSSKDKRGGGIAFLFRNTFDVRPCDLPRFNTFESLCLKVILKSSAFMGPLALLQLNSVMNYVICSINFY
jgi:hypothetical protein